MTAKRRDGALPPAWPDWEGRFRVLPDPWWHRAALHVWALVTHDAVPGWARVVAVLLVTGSVVAGAIVAADRFV